MNKLSIVELENCNGGSGLGDVADVAGAIGSIFSSGAQFLPIYTTTSPAYLRALMEQPKIG